jgi:hypothetical protein
MRTMPILLFMLLLRFVDHRLEMDEWAEMKPDHELLMAWIVNRVGTHDMHFCRVRSSSLICQPGRLRRLPQDCSPDPATLRFHCSGKRRGDSTPHPSRDSTPARRILRLALGATSFTGSAPEAATIDELFSAAHAGFVWRFSQLIRLRSSLGTWM